MITSARPPNSEDMLGEEDILDALGSEGDHEISIADIKTQMGFADDEQGTFIGMPGMM